MSSQKIPHLHIIMKDTILIIIEQLINKSIYLSISELLCWVYGCKIYFLKWSTFPWRRLLIIAFSGHCLLSSILQITIDFPAFCLIFFCQTIAEIKGDRRLSYTYWFFAIRTSVSQLLLVSSDCVLVQTTQRRQLPNELNYFFGI